MKYLTFKSYCIFASIFIDLFSISTNIYANGNMKKKYCEKETSQLGINFCLVRVARKKEDNLKNKIKDIKKKLLNSLAIQGIDNSQKIWVQYRDIQCETEKKLYIGGSLDSAIYSDCIIRLSNQRLKYINDVYSIWINK